MGVGLLQSVAGLHGTKGCMRGNASCPPDDDWAETRASLLPLDLTLSMGHPLGVQLDWDCHPVLRPSDSNRDHAFGASDSPAGQLWVLGLLRLHNFGSQFLTINLSTHVVLVLFLCDTSTVFIQVLSGLPC